MQIKYFGTWAALNHNADTMHMMISDDTQKLYIDAWGGMSLMQRILRREESKIEHLRITHCHSDHLLGIAHILRTHREWHLTIYCSRNITNRIQKIMYLIDQHKLYDRQISEELVTYVYVDEVSNITIWERHIEPLDLLSDISEQYGFIMHYKNKKIVFLGDEAIDILAKNDTNRMIDCDRLLCEALCTEKDAEIKEPHKKGHSLPSDAAKLGQTLHAKSIIISHIHDYTENRVQQLEEIKKDVESVYSGKVYVPHDNETIDLW